MDEFDIWQLNQRIARAKSLVCTEHGRAAAFIVTPFEDGSIELRFSSNPCCDAFAAIVRAAINKPS